MQTVVPAIIPESREYLLALESQLSSVDQLQVDLVDSAYAASVSWPYRVGDDMASEVAVMRELCERHEIAVDLMVADPLAAATAWLSVGASRIIVHVETMRDFAPFLQLKEEYGIWLGLSLNNDTPLEAVLAHALQIDFIQCMGIAQIGSQGQPFDERVLERVRAIKSEHPDLLVSVDGSVNAETIPRLKAAGVRRFVVGSAIVKQPDPAGAHQALTELVAAS